MKEQPKTKLFDVELAPFDDTKSKEENFKKREKELSLKEVKKLCATPAPTL